MIRYLRLQWLALLVAWDLCKAYNWYALSDRMGWTVDEEGEPLLLEGRERARSARRLGSFLEGAPRVTHEVETSLGTGVSNPMS